MSKYRLLQSLPWCSSGGIQECKENPPVIKIEFNPELYPDWFEKVSEPWADDDLAYSLVMYDRISPVANPKVVVQKFKERHGIE